MYDRDWTTGDKLGDAADVAGCDQIGLYGSYIGQLAITQRGSNLRLQDVVGPRRAAAEMPLRHIYRLEPCGGEQFFRPGVQTLSVLH